MRCPEIQLDSRLYSELATRRPTLACEAAYLAPTTMS
jgi:hypothetical protein